MSKASFTFLYGISVLLISFTVSAQDDSPAQNQDIDIDVEQSAEVFLEAYSDEFQENFFEALKQKGIENYDRAANYLLKSKQLDASNPVVDHELAKVYLKSRQFPLAEEYALTALKAEPENLWYAETLVQSLRKQNKPFEQLEADIPDNHPAMVRNMAEIYYKKGDYRTALSILKNTEGNEYTDLLVSKINDSIDQNQARASQENPVTENTRTNQASEMNGTSEVGKAAEKDGTLGADRTNGDATTGGATNENMTNPLDDLKMQLETLMQSNSFDEIVQISEEALEIYPSQPYFYYTSGYGQNKKNDHEGAIESLEAALDYLIDDVELSNKIYQELADAHTALGNSEKANTYLRKIKAGF